ncbi:MAG TPA: PhzF family phenazine biosynthesis protein [bacterium]|nr:PhzF family phenazine biosynthesis protein [bacterium]HMW35487.1 PhzF family phenazine biosynthesis protein [bacterium]HMZ03240.1 PhzF family phenazine biosynthesis protein [bacterium]HNB10884.1 PhzF family phenazine biosynthesis protein [bacterium]HNB57513.1 PhzF family phenazine biosynthesis protein [bacterium]
MKITMYQVDAFTRKVFSGNPAAVCPMQVWPEDEIMRGIAAENNLSETAFFIPQGDDFALRWFTPEVEIDLCGHATLATAHVLFEHLHFERSEIHFHTQSGKLTIRRLPDGKLLMDFPARKPLPCTVPRVLVEGLGANPDVILKARDYFCVFDSEATVRALSPDFTMLKSLGEKVIVTARGDTTDFVSRFFAPSVGINEDPVTGSAHCSLIPYWAERLGKDELYAHQVSKRGGEIFCKLRGDRVDIGGYAADYLQGTIQW